MLRWLAQELPRLLGGKCRCFQIVRVRAVKGDKSNHGSCIRCVMLMLVVV